MTLKDGKIWKANRMGVHILGDETYEMLRCNKSNRYNVSDSWNEIQRRLWGLKMSRLAGIDAI